MPSTEQPIPNVSFNSKCVMYEVNINDDKAFLAWGNMMLRRTPGRKPMSHTRSELRTLKTKAAGELRIAKQCLETVEMQLHKLPLGSEGRAAMQTCYDQIKTTHDQCEAVVKNLNAESKVVGGYKSKKKVNQVQDQPQAEVCQ